jgi:hypothetical protein
MEVIPAFVAFVIFVVAFRRYRYRRVTDG